MTVQAKFGGRKVREGTVVSDKMQKTVLVAVEEHIRHPLYKKRVRRLRRFMAHDEREESHLGDRVRIVESRPVSRFKRWRVVDVLQRAELPEVAPESIDLDLIGEMKREEQAPEQMEAAAPSAEAVPEEAVSAPEAEAVVPEEVVVEEAGAPEEVEEVIAPAPEQEEATVAQSSASIEATEPAAGQAPEQEPSDAPAIVESSAAIEATEPAEPTSNEEEPPAITAEDVQPTEAETTPETEEEAG